ncbi:MAG TPA: DUF305 domain-containing protein [Nocardioidaceae bacterium]|nr:DUF305 domain-containing protein [Nocardioidaceae bacterium]
MARLTPACGVLLLVLVTGCGAAGPQDVDAPSDVSSATTEVSADHNDTDVAYAHELTSLHQQAVDMVAMVANKRVSGELVDVAAAIGRDRSAEIGELESLLRAWKVRPHGPDFHGNPGELTMEQLADLYRLDGAAFEQAWLERMAANHEGAVAMSRAELDQGLNLAARELARRLVKEQQAQVAQLERLATD